MKLACDYLAEVGLIGDRKKYPYQLSGGMQQKVAIARALAMDAEVLLLDEPFGALDARTRADLQRLLVTVWMTGKDEAKPGKTIVFVTHDLEEALILGDRILFMSSGKIESDVRVPFTRARRFQGLEYDDLFTGFKRNLVSLFYELDDEKQII